MIAERKSGRNLFLSCFLNVRLSDMALFICLKLAMFGEAIQASTDFSYCDEIATAALIIAAIARCCDNGAALPKRVSKMARASLILLLVVVSIGFIGNLCGGVSVSWLAVGADIFACCKFPIAIVAAVYAFSTSRELALLFEGEARFLLVLMIGLGITNLLFDFGMGSEARFGLRSSFTFVFDHPTYLVFCAVGLTALLMGDKKRNMSFVVMGLLVAALSLRAKGLAFSVVGFLLLATFGKRNKLTLGHVVLVIAAATFIGADQIANYYQSTGYARTELARQSLTVATDYFPLGSGFATYGSAVTAQNDYYSPLYYTYGLSTIWGLTPSAPLFISDTFWPTVLAEFGYVGLPIYIALLVTLFVMCYQFRGARLSIICIFLYLLISSTSESAFFNPSSVYLAMCIGLSIPLGKRSAA